MSGNRVLLLLAIADATLRLIVERNLPRDTYKVVTANDGFAASEKLEKADPVFALIIIDLALPVMTGWQVLANIAANKRYDDIPIIILAADEAEMQAPDDLAGRRIAFLLKPFHVANLVSLVETTLPVE